MDLSFYCKHFDKKIAASACSSERPFVALHPEGVQRDREGGATSEGLSFGSALSFAESQAESLPSPSKEAEIFIGDSIKVGVVFNERRLQFFTGIVTKIHGHKITLYQPGIERIFSYKNPQINTFLIMAVPKRRSKSRKILWRGAAVARLRRGPKRKT